MEYTAKLARLRAVLKDLGAVAIAYSGGADSTLLLKVTVDELGPSALAIIVDGGVTPASEVAAAVTLARGLGTEPVVLKVDLLSITELVENRRNRCYICKLAIMNAVIRAAWERGFSNIVDGSHSGDVDRERPGIRALRELGVRSPLREAGLEKGDVREASALLSLVTAEKPASPCLATRIPFGQLVTIEKLGQIEAAERAVRGLGIAVVRVRHHGSFARIEVPLVDIPTLRANLASIKSMLRALGFDRVEVDPRGYRSGSLDELKEQQKE